MRCSVLAAVGLMTFYTVYAAETPVESRAAADAPSSTVEGRAQAAVAIDQKTEPTKTAEPVKHLKDFIAPSGSCPNCSGAADDPPPSSTVTDWIEPAQRSKLDLDFELTTQDSKKIKLKDLFDKPAAIGFFFSRCGNPRKCPLAVATMAQLQAKSKEAGLDGKVRLIMITYDPEFDSPTVIKEYGKGKGMQFNENVLMLRPEPKDKEKLFETLKAPVNYNAKGVNIHSLELLLLDNSARVVRDYHSVIWDNAKVLEDLKRLVDDK